MANQQAIVEAAVALCDHDEASLELQIGKIDKATKTDPSIADDPNPQIAYDGNTMGPIDDLRDIGRRITKKWAKVLHDIVCGDDEKNAEDRKKVLDSVGLGEVAMIGAVAAALSTLVTPALAAPLAALIVKRFLPPVKEGICEFWDEKLQSE